MQALYSAIINQMVKLNIPSFPNPHRMRIVIFLYIVSLIPTDRDKVSFMSSHWHSELWQYSAPDLGIFKVCDTGLRNWRLRSICLKTKQNNNKILWN